MKRKRTRPSRLVFGRGEIYAAKLLFQWRKVDGRRRWPKRLCEERVILIRAKNAAEALKKAKRYGKEQRFAWRFPDGREQLFEFVGVIDLDSMFTDFQENPAEVWYELKEVLRPMERRRQLLKPARRMRAFGVPDRRPGELKLWW